MDPQNSMLVNQGFANIRKKILERLGPPRAWIKKHHFVLVHEAGHGAWCWFKTADLLLKSRHQVTVFDLAASGLHSTHPSNVSTFEEYAQPLLDVLQSIQDPDKVVLVGHGLGGMALAYASQLFASKIAVAVYVAALMVPGGLQSLKEEMLMLKGNEKDGKDIDFIWDKDTTPIVLSKEILYNTTASEDIQLASTLLRPIPMAAKAAKVETSEEGYGRVPRVYITTSEDRACPMEAQEAMIKMNPPHRVLKLKCDHSPFFSASKHLHNMLLEIADTHDR